jgi:beta-lactamase superfamily II metal-dependent hydrolase
MKIKFLKAGTGDSILVQHKSHNIIIDGGNDSKYLLSEVDKIFSEGQAIDLLVITHHDDDHIKGIIDLLNHINEKGYNKDLSFIKKVIFNSPRKALGKLPEYNANQLSYKQAYDVEELLNRTQADWKRYTDKSESLNFDDLVIDILSPTDEDLGKYSVQKGAYLTGDFKCDWNSPMDKLERFIDDSSIDKSISNKNSIVLKLQIEYKAILLTGDTTPDRLESVLTKLTNENDGNPVKFDLVKLPHHGSYRSITKQVINKIKCNTFIISTNSKKHFLPNKRALLKILKYTDRTDRQPINFVFNYEETINNLEITNKNKKDYNFILTPNNKTYGISY